MNDLRFDRQIILPHMGPMAQQKLLQHKVLVIGVGGLGCACLQYLITAGIGSLGMVDGDSVDVSNLHRQILFDEEDIGLNKAHQSIIKLSLLMPAATLEAFPFFIDEKNATELISKYDLVIDCTDDFKTRFLINDVCVNLHKPLILAANFQYEGQIFVFENKPNGIQLRDVFEQIPTQAIRCEEAGALGPILGILGCWQALEAIKWITHHPQKLTDEMLYINVLSYDMQRIKIEKNMLRKKTVQTPLYMVKEIDAILFETKINNPNVQVVDVRNADENPVVDFDHVLIPLASLRTNIHLLDRGKEIVLFCHSGIRSLTALDILQDEFQFENIAHLKGGIIKYWALKKEG